jgi:hypothetical protein
MAITTHHENKVISDVPSIFSIELVSTMVISKSKSTNTPKKKHENGATTQQRKSRSHGSESLPSNVRFIVLFEIFYPFVLNSIYLYFICERLDTISINCALSEYIDGFFVSSVNSRQLFPFEELSTVAPIRVVDYSHPTFVFDIEADADLAGQYDLGRIQKFLSRNGFSEHNLIQPSSERDNMYAYLYIFDYYVCNTFPICEFISLLNVTVACNILIHISYGWGISEGAFC